MPKLDLDMAPVKTGSIYPEPYASMMRGRSSLRLGDAGGSDARWPRVTPP